jgi:hypothetical protein
MDAMSSFTRKSRGVEGVQYRRVLGLEFSLCENGVLTLRCVASRETLCFVFSSFTVLRAIIRPKKYKIVKYCTVQFVLYSLELVLTRKIDYEINEFGLRLMYVYYLKKTPQSSFPPRKHTKRNSS